MLTEKNLSGNELARELRVDPATVSRWINEIKTGKGGVYRPTADQFLYLARKFGVKMDSLVDDDADLATDASIVIPEAYRAAYRIMQAIGPEAAFNRLVLSPEVTPRSRTLGDDSGMTRNSG